MRPNIDVPWSVHGEIKEYATHHSLSIEKAYIQLLGAALEDSPPLTDGPTVSLTGKPSNDSSVTSIDKINGMADVPVTLFSHNPGMNETGWLQNIDHPVIIGGARDSELTGDFREICEKIGPYLERGKNGGDFSITHETGTWVGRGLDTFYQVFTDNDRKHEQEGTLEKPRLETAVFVASVSHSPSDSKYVLLTAVQSIDSSPISNRPRAQIAVIVDGYPIEQSGNWHTLLERTGGSTDTAKPFAVDTLSLSPNDNLTVVDRLSADQSEGTSSVGKVLIENPWYQQKEAVEQLLDPIKIPPSFPLHEYKHLVATLKSTKSITDDTTFVAKNFEIQRFQIGDTRCFNLKITLQTKATVESPTVR